MGKTVVVPKVSWGQKRMLPVEISSLQTGMVSTGPGIQFNAKGQNDKLKNSAFQNRGGKLVTVAPKTASNATPELPMSPYDKRS